MSWKIGKSKSKQSPALGVDELSPRSTTPTPGNPDGKPHSCPGLLAIRVLWAEDLSVPGGNVPPAVQAALNSQQAKVAASVSPSSVNEQRLASKRSNRDSVQRTQCWWLAYLVMEFEVNQVLITPLGGDLQKPLYMYETNL
jgi:serum/glucocorticoid-regulated kinase 2